MSRVLIVEDDPGVREFLRAVLGQAGISFRLAGSGRQALSQAREIWPDVVLLDLTLPGNMDGWEVWQALAQLAGERILRVWIFTAEWDSTSRTRAKELGAQGAIGKPILPQALVQILREALAEKSQV